MSDLPDFGFQSQAMQCQEKGKYSAEKCWGGCPRIAALKYPDWSGPCPRGILDEYGGLFHAGE